MRARNLIVGITLAAAVFAPQSIPVLGGTAPRHVDVEVGIAPSDGGKYELHIGTTAWLATQGGAATYLTESPVRVQFWRVRDCELLASYRADPNTLTQIVVNPDSGDVTVLHPEIVDIPVEILDTETPPRCSLPETSTIATAPGSSALWTSLGLGVLMLGMTLLFSGRGWRKRRRGGAPLGH
jgi:hypothetical protein